MAPVLLLLVLLPAAASDQETVTGDLGDDVILPCRMDAPSIGTVEWSRPDLEHEYVLLHRDGRLDPTLQHPEFKGRVDLVDRDLKDGDASLILKNVRRIDAGTYECRAVPYGPTRGSRLYIDSQPITTVRLLVTVPSSVVGNSSPGGRPRGPVPGLLLLVAAVLTY
ncbi:myelin-oligodendrocyte glycoprotein [Etheostoma spectabile]|uniref:myelin-oligodendrocyte glycoprotein n=1 Tax=Etheostoma spectabile TaxID=54343 RepID=UPI0013AED5C2|nr:myelin-oligodendrocyte glycoprotein-like [Etheostoma spectabile]XP_032364015.1 myelin-oligodendrocyte glycoprotein-like [Etheostoma spectabile]XP_032364016.1 myelin-oligodendrocyte glycoprotein-like [Etheostoma spectabile]XP_032364017.1 myelin-oligodendrocyte glycoprotein-like [Etheostoma spectabile]XP_032364018.1 myelin-oligodendrocyte glycoprotein-like [Etheostoma spectabile]XP_032364019.1 myelin-oligodendrocyte glycoprotein-like [Etheostoma spectabile]